MFKNHISWTTPDKLTILYHHTDLELCDISYTDMTQFWLFSSWNRKFNRKKFLQHYIVCNQCDREGEYWTSMNKGTRHILSLKIWWWRHHRSECSLAAVFKREYFHISEISEQNFITFSTMLILRRPMCGWWRHHIWCTAKHLEFVFYKLNTCSFLLFLAGKLPSSSLYY